MTMFDDVTMYGSERAMLRSVRRDVRGRARPFPDSLIRNFLPSLRKRLMFPPRRRARSRSFHFGSYPNRSLVSNDGAYSFRRSNDDVFRRSRGSFRRRRRPLSFTRRNHHHGSYFDSSSSEYASSDFRSEASRFSSVRSTSTLCRFHKSLRRSDGTKRLLSVIRFDYSGFSFPVPSFVRGDRPFFWKTVQKPRLRS